MFNPDGFNTFKPALNLIYTLYINALRMMIFPLVFCSIVMGIQGIGSVGKTGRIGGQTLLYYCGTALFASLLGLFLPKLLNFGKGVAFTLDATNPYGAVEFTSLLDTVKNLIPSNPVASFVNGYMLQVLVFAIIIGIVCLSLKEKAEPFVKVVDSVNTLCDMGATCCNVLGDIACSVAMKETCKLDILIQSGSRRRSTVSEANILPEK